MVRVSSPTRLAVAALGLVALGGVLGACSDDSGDTTGRTSATPSAPAGATSGGGSTDPGGGPAPVDTAKPAVAVSSAPPVRVGRATQLTGKVKVLVSQVEPVKVKASGPGDIAGDGVAVHLKVSNSSGKSFSLDGLAVTASYGDDVPASPGGAKTGDALSGKLGNGKTASGIYVFSVPKAEAGSVRVQVSSDESPLILTFTR